MGERLTDVEINLAQRILKSQFPNVSGLHSTLFLGLCNNDKTYISIAPPKLTSINNITYLDYIFMYYLMIDDQ